MRQIHWAMAMTSPKTPSRRRTVVPNKHSKPSMNTGVAQDALRLATRLDMGGPLSDLHRDVAASAYLMGNVCICSASENDAITDLDFTRSRGEQVLCGVSGCRTKRQVLPTEKRQLKRCTAKSNIHDNAKLQVPFVREWSSVAALNPATPRLQAIREFLSTGDLPNPTTGLEPGTTENCVKFATIRKLSSRPKQSAGRHGTKTEVTEESDFKSAFYSTVGHPRATRISPQYGGACTDSVTPSSNQTLSTAAQHVAEDGSLFKSPPMPVVEANDCNNEGRCRESLSTAPHPTEPTVSSSCSFRECALVPLETTAMDPAGSLSALIMLGDNSATKSRISDFRSDKDNVQTRTFKQRPSAARGPSLGVKRKVHALSLDSMDMSLVCDLKRRLERSSRVSRIKTNGSLRTKIVQTQRLGVASPRTAFKIAASRKAPKPVSIASTGPLKGQYTVATEV